MLNQQLTMKILAYCTKLAGEAVEKAVRGKALTSPPLTATDLKPFLVSGHFDLFYFRLHSGPASTVWFGDDGERRPIAFVPGCLEGLDLGGAVVVLANCHGEINPLVRTFYRLGARAVIAGPGKNYASGKRVIGADLLVAWIIRGIERGLSPERALQLAKTRLVLTAAWRGPDRDALGFRIMENKQ